MTKTYFILSRKIFESAIWRDDPHILKLFIYLVGMARHYNKPQSYPTFKIKRGELVTSLRNISDDNEYFNKTVRKWSSGKVSRMLHKLQEQGYINILADTYGTHLKICNYDTYQTTTNYGANSSGTEANSSGTVVETNNNDNNDKNDKNVYRAFKHLSLSETEFESLKKKGLTKQQIDSYCDLIENYAKNKNYNSLNLTIQSWWRRDKKSSPSEFDNGIGGM